MLLGQPRRWNRASDRVVRKATPRGTKGRAHGWFSGAREFLALAEFVAIGIFLAG
jgi:hypothetical protein